MCHTAKCGRAPSPSAQSSTICVPHTAKCVLTLPYMWMPSSPQSWAHCSYALSEEQVGSAGALRAHCADFRPVNLGEVAKSTVNGPPPGDSTSCLLHGRKSCGVLEYCVPSCGLHGVLPWLDCRTSRCTLWLSLIPFKPFHDATYMPSDFPVTLLDCLMSLKKSIDLGWYRHATFDTGNYEYWDYPLNSDIHQ